MSAAATRERIAPYADDLAIAAINGPASTLLSGEPGAIERLLTELSEAEVVAYVAEVVLDAQKRFRVQHVVAAVDCGQAVNPIGIEQQVEGGVLWAMAQLHNQIIIRKGRVEQSTYRDYPVPRIDDAPTIEVHILPSNVEQPLGMGEPPVPPLVPAVLNAYFAASGVRVWRLPVSSG